MRTKQQPKLSNIFVFKHNKSGRQWSLSQAVLAVIVKTNLIGNYRLLSQKVAGK